MFVPDGLREALSDEAYLAAMLRFEAALAVVEARAGVIPEEEADAVVGACDPARFDLVEIGRAAVSSATPVVPLAKALREASSYAHWGATSQDTLDTATMLVARDALALVLGELDGVAAAAARLAGEHRDTLMAGRTLLQQAQPVTFGLKTAGWLAAVLDARRRLADAPLAVQFGGAAGTLATLGDAGPQVLAGLAQELGLEEPELPWHTARGRIGELAGALAVAAGALGKAGGDIVLLAQTEVGEVTEASGGGSSAMPHKQNPAAAVRTRACAQQAVAAASAVLASAGHEHERAAGAWQAEWLPLRAALGFTGGAAAALRQSLEGLQVHPERMRENLDPVLVDELPEPGGELGSAGVFVDRALERYRREVT
jgi:3-carboxy-cis,cis-muconate cycloisomerase